MLLSYEEIMLNKSQSLLVNHFDFHHSSSYCPQLIGKFLDIPLNQVRSKNEWKKRTPNNLQQAISNYDEIVSLLRSINSCSQLEEQFIDKDYYNFPVSQQSQAQAEDCLHHVEKMPIYKIKNR
jgi:hypothetical protein